LFEAYLRTSANSLLIWDAKSLNRYVLVQASIFCAFIVTAEKQTIFGSLIHKLCILMMVLINLNALTTQSKTFHNYFTFIILLLQLYFIAEPAGKARQRSSIAKQIW